MFRHAMSWSPCPRRCFAVPFLHIAPPLALRSDPPRSSRRRPAARRGGTLFPRVSPVRPCAGAGGRIAAARFARLIARARRRTHLPRPLPPGLSAPAALCREQKRRPASRLFLHPSYHTFPQVKPPRRTDPEIAARFRAKRTARLRLAGPRAPESPAGPPPPPTPDTGQETAPAIAVRFPPPASRTAAGRRGSVSAPSPGLSAGAGRWHGRSCGSGPRSCFPSPVSRRWR